MRISEERLNHLEDRSKELTVARAQIVSLMRRIKELEVFVMAEGDCHVSADEFKRLEGEVESLCDVREAALDVWRKLHYTEDLDELGDALTAAFDRENNSERS